jgi:hypothetical protein
VAGILFRSIALPSILVVAALAALLVFFVGRR